MRAPVLIIVSAALIAGFAASPGCKDKTPYPSPEKLRVQAAADVVTTPDPGRPEALPARALAFIRTAKGTTVVAGHDSGDGLVVSQIPGHAWAMEDGSVRVVKVVSRTPAVNTPRKRSSLAGLVMEEYRPEGGGVKTVDLTPDRTASWDETSGFIKDAVEADPETAGEYYHVEKIVGIGSSGPVSTWLVTVDSWLGGAHPSNPVKLLVVDLSAGTVVDLSSGFAGRDVVAEVLGDRYEAACVRDNCGVAPMEALGGAPVWVVLLCAAFGSCEGQYQMELIATPAVPADEGRPVLEGQILNVPGAGTVERGVVDYRTSEARNVAVVEMALGSLDEVAFPWTPAKGRAERSKTREVRFWISGMKQAAVIGRLPEVQSVQFIPPGKPASDVLLSLKGVSN